MDKSYIANLIISYTLTVSIVLLSIIMLVGKIPYIGNKPIAWGIIGVVVLGIVVNAAMSGIYFKNMTMKKWYMLGIPYRGVIFGMK